MPASTLAFLVYLLVVELNKCLCVKDLLANLSLQLFLGEMQNIAFRLMLSSCLWLYVCVCLCVCLSVCLCVCRFVDLRKTVWDRDVVFVFKLRWITPNIISKSLTQIWLWIPRWRTQWWPWNTIIGCNSVIYYYRDFVFSLDCSNDTAH